MSLLPTTPGFFQRGIQTLTGLFRKSEPSLNVIQQLAEVSKVEIDETVNETRANKLNIKILSKPNPDVPDVRYFPHLTDVPDVPHVPDVPQLNVEEINSLLTNDAAIDDKIASSVPPDIEQQYEETQTRRFNEELAKITTQSQTEVQYKIGCRHGIEVELGDVLASCSLTRKEVLSLYTSLSDEFYSRITKDFGEHCSYHAAESVGRVTDSWLPDIKLPIPLLLRGPEATKNQTFFKRTALYLDAFKAYNVFNTPNWRSYKSYENKRMTDPHHPPALFWNMQYEREWREEWANEWPRRWAEKNPLSPAPPPPPPAPPRLPDPEPFVPPGGPANPGYNFRIKIDPYFYVVGPIVEFENIEGRTLIYVKCYDDNTFTTGIYFWVYLSQSEGKFRVFFKLRANSIIEKGFDYTQGTLVDFRLQGILSRYYDMNYSKGKQHPIKINTLKRVIYFVDNMPYLQSRFLDNFPLPLLMYADNSACCRVFPPPPPPYTRDGLGRVKGLVCHYYLIHKKYNAIFHQGFPLAAGEINNYFPGGDTNPDNQYCTQLISSGHHSIFDDFRKGPVGAQAVTFSITEPLIYCFTTSCPKTTLVSFDDLLNVMNYTATVWFQGFQNFTRILGGILSPVLYVIIGAMVERPDFELSSIRDQMLGISASAINSAPLSVRDYKKHSAALMTLGTEEFRPAEPTLYLPASPPARTTGTQSHATRRQHDFGTEIQEQIRHVTNKVEEVLSRIPQNIAPIPDTDIRKHLIDFGLLAIKADWLKRKFDDSYEARGSVFPDSVDDTIDQEDELDSDAKIKKMEVYCLCKDDTFLKLPENVCCLDPNTPFLQTLPSKFNETRIDHDHPANGEVKVVVDTLAQQYCMKFSYVKTPENQVKKMYVMIQLSSTIVYTLATPTSPFNKILYAIDKQKTPIACLPEYRLNETPQGANRDEYMRIIRETQAGGGSKYATTPKQMMKAAATARAAQAARTAQAAPNARTARTAQAAPNARTARTAQAAPNAGVGKPKADSKKDDAIAAAEQKRQAEQQRQAEQEAKVAAAQKKILDDLQAVLSTDRTMLSTPKRVSSWGAFFAGKMMEYLFGQYFQLPTLFKLYARWLQVCHAYYTTALIYNYNTSRPCVFFNTTPLEGKSYSFATLFAAKLTSEGFIAPPAPGAPPGVTPPEIRTYVTRRLIEHTAAIKLIGKHVTAPFLDYTPEDALSSVASSSVSSDASSSVSRTSSADSYFSPQKGQSKEALLHQFLLSRDLKSSQEKDDESYVPSSRGSSQNRGRSRSPELPELPEDLHSMKNGGSLTINKSIKKGRTKRKNRKTTRKNGKVNRMVKKHTTKYKTYKRKANGRKLKGNNHKNNKTMRRYRRVRK